VVIYLLLRPLAGGLVDSARKILSVATDVKRLQGAPVAAWAIAIARGCVLVPIFEEWLFRGALLQWLRRYFSNRLAIVVSAVLFAAMHLYPIVMPYTFVAGLFTGWIRVRTGSTLNTIFIHVLNNLVFLYLGFLLLR
jgi:membrane protease YdiL (CAAX protease family)